jgi:hypothetical protein
MARRVFFSFHYERDVWRASQVRNSWVTKPDREAAGFWDAASWEEVKKKGEEAIKAWIREQLKGTSVTVVLIGTETYKRKYVQYEIEQSCQMGNGLLSASTSTISKINMGAPNRKAKTLLPPWDTRVYLHTTGYVVMATTIWAIG